MYSLGVDTGGTFTDFVLHDRDSGDIVTFKMRSTPEDPGAAVEAGLERLTSDHGVSGATLERFIFGTTVATNAVLEGRGAKTALVATRGTRDVLEIQRQWRSRLFDLYLEKPKPLVPRRHRIELIERVDAAGAVLTPLDDAEIDRVVEAIRVLPVEAVAVSLIFSFLNPEHEERMAAAIRARLQHLPVTISSGVCPEFREYERTATVVMNAYTMPKIAALADRLDRALADFGFEGAFSLIQSNGGVMSLDKARRHPVNTLLSGPAAGVVAAAAVGRASQADRVIAFDVGGTSTDISLVEGGAVRLSAEGGIAGYPVKVPQVRVHTIGAGGGSIARPELGLLKVGPQSAGADPGPACYGRGGAAPTTTDAAVVLGHIDPDRFLDGEIALDRDAALRAVDEAVAKPLGLDVEAAALAILQVQAANIVTGIRKVSVEAGQDPRDYALMPFGGAGGLFAGLVAAEAGIGRILLPPHASVLSALGMLMTDIRHDVSGTRLTPLAGAEKQDLAEAFRPLMAEAARELTADRVPEGCREYAFACDMRYEGQSYEITVPVAGTKDGPEIDLEALRAAFDAAHRDLYGQASPEEPVEIVNVRVGGIGVIDKVALPEAVTAAGDAGPLSRPVLFSATEGWTDCPVHVRDAMAPGTEITGPAIIEDRGASIPLRPGHTARVLDNGVIEILTGARS